MAGGTGIGKTYHTMKERTTSPSTPGTTYDRLFFKSDGLHYVNSAGTDITLSGDTSPLAEIWTAASELTIATDAITVTQTLHRVDTAADAASDDLSTISGGAAGQLLAIRAEHTDRTVVVKHNVGNILTGGADITLDDTSKYILFVYDGDLTKWVVAAGGSVSTDAIWDAAGDLVQGTGANTAAKLTKGAEGTILRAGASSNAYSTSTFADTYAIGTILHGSASNTVTGLAAGATGQVLMGATGAAPAWTATPSGLTSIEATTVTVGKADGSAGGNGTINATLGATILTWDEANWNEDDSTWTMTTTGPLAHVSGNTTAVTATLTEAVVAGSTYAITWAGTGGGATCAYSFGGMAGTTLAASGAIAFTDYITASTTGVLIITPSSTSTISITSVTIKKLTDATGDLTVDGNIVARSPIILPKMNSGTYTQLRSGWNAQTGINLDASDVYRLFLNGTVYAYISSSQTSFPAAVLTIGADTLVGRNAANTFAVRNSTTQQTFQVFNTADAVMGTNTNYERLTLTGVQGASVNITAETAGTGGDNLDIILTPAGTGGVTYKIKEEIEPATDTITAAQCYGSIINNYGQSGDATLTLPAAAAGMHFTVILGTTVANYFRLDPDASDKIYIDGAADADGHYIGIASAVAGAALSFRSFQTGAGAYDWYVSVMSGAWVME